MITRRNFNAAAATAIGFPLNALHADQFRSCSRYLTDKQIAYGFDFDGVSGKPHIRILRDALVQNSYDRIEIMLDDVRLRKCERSWVYYIEDCVFRWNYQPWWPAAVFWTKATMHFQRCRFEWWHNGVWYKAVIGNKTWQAPRYVDDGECFREDIMPSRYAMFPLVDSKDYLEVTPETIAGPFKDVIKTNKSGVLPHFTSRWY